MQLSGRRLARMAQKDTFTFSMSAGDRTLPDFLDHFLFYLLP